MLGCAKRGENPLPFSPVEVPFSHREFIRVTLSAREGLARACSAQLTPSRGKELAMPSHHSHVERLEVRALLSAPPTTAPTHDTTPVGNAGVQLYAPHTHGV